MKKTFCSFCGKEEGLFFTGRFNKEDGSKEFKKVCHNVNCEVGCVNSGGHFQRVSLFGTIKPCKRCGSERVFGV